MNIQFIETHRAQFIETKWIWCEAAVDGFAFGRRNILFVDKHFVKYNLDEIYVLHRYFSSVGYLSDVKFIMHVILALHACRTVWYMAQAHATCKTDKFELLKQPRQFDCSLNASIHIVSN